MDLEGEAYFDVAKDAERPFIVHASSLNIKAVGTVFVVKSYPQDETVETTLLRGIIEVSRKDYPDGSEVILKPNEKLIFSKQPENEMPRIVRLILRSITYSNCWADFCCSHFKNHPR